MLSRQSLLSMSIGASIAVASLPAIAEPVTLKFSHIYPADHYLVEHGFRLFSEAVEERTNGEIKFEVYPAGQLGKDQLSLLEYGVTDMAMLTPSAQSDKFPLSTVTELPGMFSSSCEGTEKLASIGSEGKILDDLELSPNGVHPLFFSMLPQYAVLTSDRKVTSLEDFSGLKIRANGAALGATFRALNAIPIQLGSTELYNAVTRGTVDGAYFPYMPIVNYSLENDLRFSLDGLALGSSGIYVATSDRVWSQLSDETRQIMSEEAASVQKSLCKWMDEASEKARDELMAEYGMEVVFASDELIEAVREKVSSVNEEWASRMDGAGLKGSLVLKAFSKSQAQ